MKTHTKISVLLEYTYLSLMGFGLFFMVGVILWQVVARYIFQTGTLIAEEAVAFAMVYIGMIGTSYAFYARKHMAVTLWADKLEGVQRKNLQFINDSLVIISNVILHLCGGVVFVNLTKDQTLTTIPVSAAVLNVSLVISGVLTTVLLTISLIDNIKSRRV